MYYVQRGSVPPQRHTQHRAPNGSLYAEELFGVEGFTGRSSLLYHLTPPTRTHRIEPVASVRLEAADDGLHRHRLTKTAAVQPSGDVVTGRVPLYFNNDVVFGVALCSPASKPPRMMPPGRSAIASRSARRRAAGFVRPSRIRSLVAASGRAHARWHLLPQRDRRRDAVRP